MSLFPVPIQLSYNYNLKKNIIVQLEIVCVQTKYSTVYLCKYVYG